MTYTRFFPLVNIPKQQQKQDVADAARRITVGGKEITMARPEYETEAAVTKAIANGTFKGSSSKAYADAKEWQKQLKAAEQKTIFVKKPKPTPNHTTLTRYSTFGA